MKSFSFHGNMSEEFHSKSAQTNCLESTNQNSASFGLILTFTFRVVGGVVKLQRTLLKINDPGAKMHSTTS